MNAKAKSQKILKELNFDFSTFTIARLLCHVSRLRGRVVLAVPWEMKSTLFGAWISDGDDPCEYLFYRDNLSQAHQIHIQLHELAHFLLGHPTLKVSRPTVSKILTHQTEFPFAALPHLRSSRTDEMEVEAETLTDAIQRLVIRHSKLGMLIRDLAPQEKLAEFLQTVGAP